MSAAEGCVCCRGVCLLERGMSIVGYCVLPQAMSKEHAVCLPEPMESEDMLFTLYTSGSTGKPKGLAHSQAGYLLYAGMTHQFAFDYQPGDLYCCVADVGWITGHSYVVYGPLSNGAVTTLFEPVPTYPNPGKDGGLGEGLVNVMVYSVGRYWEMVERLKLNQLYTSPTAIRTLNQFSDDFVTKYDRTSLRIIGSGKYGCYGYKSMTS